MEDFRSLGKRLSNWGRWGAEDERGTLNLITPEQARPGGHDDPVGQGVRPRHPVRRRGPQPGGGRINPVHLMSQTGDTQLFPGASSTPTTTSSCRCRARRSGTPSPTSSTTTRCTTASRPRGHGRRCDAQQHRQARARASPGGACCSTSRSSRASTGSTSGMSITPDDLEAAIAAQGGVDVGSRRHPPVPHRVAETVPHPSIAHGVHGGRTGHRPGLLRVAPRPRGRRGPSRQLGDRGAARREPRGRLQRALRAHPRHGDDAR